MAGGGELVLEGLFGQGIGLGFHLRFWAVYGDGGMGHLGGEAMRQKRMDIKPA